MTTFENGVIKEMYSVERQTPLPLTNDVTVATHLNRLYDLCSQFQGVPANAILKVSVLYICISRCFPRDEQEFSFISKI